MILGLVIALLLLVSFAFSGMEAGILSVNRVRLRNRVKHRDRAALRLQRLLKEPERLLLTVVIVTHLANIFAITLATLALVRRFGHAGYGVSLVLFLPLYFFGLELFPKALFRRFPTHALARLSELLRLAYVALAPLFRLGSLFFRHFLKTAEPDSGKLFAAREDFKYFTLESERSGAITPAQRRLIHGVVDFRSVTAGELMQPLAEFPVIAQGADVEELVAASEGGGKERFLVVSEAGEVLGMVSLFEILLTRSPKARISSHIRQLPPVAASEPALRVLRSLRATRARVALVMDGPTPKGLVFAEALYRRLVSGSPA